MAENKKSVVLYVDIISTFESLEDDEAGRLIKHYLRYVNDLNPTPPDKLTQIAFEPIKQQLKRDLIKWDTERKQRSDSGKKGMEKRWNNNNNNVIKSITNDNNVIKNITNDNNVIKNITNITDNVNVNENVSVNVKEINTQPFNILSQEIIWKGIDEIEFLRLKEAERQNYAIAVCKYFYEQESDIINNSRRININKNEYLKQLETFLNDETSKKSICRGTIELGKHFINILKKQNHNAKIC